MSKRLCWNKKENKLDYREVPCEKFYTKEDLIEVYYSFKDLDRNAKYYVLQDRMLNEKGEVVYRPKYKGDYPRVIREFKNLEKYLDFEEQDNE